MEAISPRNQRNEEEEKDVGKSLPEISGFESMDSIFAKHGAAKKNF